MAVLSAQHLEIAFGGRPLLEGASLQVERGERVGLLGRNGEGKSTLLSILAGETSPDGGVVTLESGTRVALLAQQVPRGIDGSVEQVVRAGLAPGGPAHDIDRLCSLLDLDAVATFAELSGGQKRRALLARALAADPDVLLLDEPTNHLDLDGIAWLEDFLARRHGTLVFVTHDRAFLQGLATRIVELDRGVLTSWACDYPTYLRRKDEQLEAEERAWAQMDRKLAAEEAWVRQGIKARRTRNEGRVRALERLRAERAARRERVGQVRMTVQQAERSGRRVIVADDVSFMYAGADAPVVRGLTTTIVRGDKVGVIGPNGSGKTTLLRVLLGTLEPTGGTVEHGVGLEVVHFDQHREQLDEAKSVADAVGFGSDHVTLDGERRHVLGYLQDFLFTPERARQPVSSLSGGERNRLLLARLFTRPANVLVLDEPTNDLDTETLELLEARLVGFDGTVLVVSHDRAFLDAVCSSTLVFEGSGAVKEYVGGYSDWRRVADARDAEARPRPDRPTRTGPRRSTESPRRLSWKEGKELESLPARIEALETELDQIHATLGEADFYRGEGEAVRRATERAKEIEAEIAAAFERWGELSEREG